MLKRILVAVPAAIAIAAAANAATLSVIPDKYNYNVGETITLTVTGDDEGATAYFIYGRLTYSGALVDNGTRSQTLLLDPDGSWIGGSLQATDNGSIATSEAFNQISNLAQGQPADNLPGVVSTVTLIAQASGIVNVNWDTAGHGTELSFFGLTSAPGTQFCIGFPGEGACSIPEPTTGALLAAGLIALAARRRRR